MRLWSEGQDEDGDFIVRFHADVDGEQWRFAGHGKTLGEALGRLGGVLMVSGQITADSLSSPVPPVEGKAR